jgi:voltage-gated sodium channel
MTKRIDGTGQIALNPFARAVAHRWFRGAVLGAILVGAVLVGLETVPSIHDAYGEAIWGVDRLVLAVFVVEVVLKILAEGRRPWRYFADPWNVFDFAVTAICLLPLDAKFAQVLRLGRVARSLRLITALPRLQLIVSALLRSLPSFGWITLLLFTLLYVYSVMAVFLFGQADPERFGSLWKSVLTMFGVLTLEGWVDIMGDQMKSGAPVMAPVFFVSFIMSGTMIFLNLLVGVIVNSMSELPEGAVGAAGAKAKEPASPLPVIHSAGAESEHVTLVAERLARLEATLAEVTAELRELRRSRGG